MTGRLFKNPQTPFWLIAFCLLIGLTVPTLIKDGMFMDAMLYTSVSHNLSNGIGTFWFPQFSFHNVGGLASFHEQPPLVFGIQSLFFSLLGDSMYIERFYTFLTMCITAFLIVVLWKMIIKASSEEKIQGWFPLIFWITIPVCFWSYSNNMHENSMGIFTIASVLFSYKSFHSKTKSILFILLSGIMIFLATLSKGIPGFFPVCVPLLYWLITKRIKFTKGLIFSILLVVVPSVIYIILFLIPESNESLSTYLFKRALHRIGNVPTVDNRFYILFRLFTELIPQLFLVLIFFIISRIKKIRIFISKSLREAIFFISVGLSASLPLMLTMVQKGFYFVPALPFMAIGLALLVSYTVSVLIDKINIRSLKYKMFLYISVVLFISVIAFSAAQAGKTGRDKERLHDIYLIGEIIPPNSIVSLSQSMWNDDALQCYMIRYFNISLDHLVRHDYFILDKSIKEDSLGNYKKLPLSTVKYDLYKKIK